MNASDHFHNAGRCERISAWVFRAITLMSGLLLFLTGTSWESAVEVTMIVATISAIVLSILTQCSQNEGNRAIRASQLSDAFDVPLGDRPRDGYYNTTVSPSLARLAVTTFENSLFTSTILQEMLKRQRLLGSGYLGVFVLLMAIRGSSLSFLLYVAQALFSADMVLRWLRMERFYWRAARIFDDLHKFFLAGGRVSEPHGVAIALNAFTDYECAKEEAAIPIDSAIFQRLNPALSKKWDQIRADLKIE